MRDGEFRIRVGERIRLERDAARLSRRALATMLDVDDGTVYRWETGDAFPVYANIVALAKALEISEERLLCGCKPKRR